MQVACWAASLMSISFTRKYAPISEQTDRELKHTKRTVQAVWLAIDLTNMYLHASPLGLLRHTEVRATCRTQQAN